MLGIDKSCYTCTIVRINLDLLQVFVTRDSGHFSAGINKNLMDENTTPAEGAEESTPTPSTDTPTTDSPATDKPAEDSTE